MSSTALPEMGFSTSLYPLYPMPSSTSHRKQDGTRPAVTLPEQGFAVDEHHQLYPAPKTRPTVPASSSLNPPTVSPPSGSSPAASDTSDSKRLKATVDTLERRLIAREDVIASMTRDKKKQDAVIEQLQRDIQTHATRHADLTRELEAEEAHNTEQQTKITDLVQHSVRLQEALLVVQSQLHDAKQVVSMYEDRISRLEYDVISKQFPISTADTVDFSQDAYPRADSGQSLSLPYDIIYDGDEPDGVEESKNGYGDGDGNDDDRHGDDYDYNDHNGSDDQSEAAETDCSEGAAEVGLDSARDSATNSDGDDHDDDRSLHTETETESDVADAHHGGVSDVEHDDDNDRATGMTSAGKDNDDTSAAVLKALTVPSSTTRRVILKKGGGGRDVVTKPAVVSAPDAAHAHDQTFAVRVKGMSARDMSRLTVPELTQLLEGLGKAYCKPKAAAVALLMTIAKDL